MTATKAARGGSEEWARTTRSGKKGNFSKIDQGSNKYSNKGEGEGNREANKGHYIVKPIGGCQGKNIFLISGMSGWKRVSKAHQVHGLIFCL